MKKLKKLCGAVLIAAFMLPQIALGSTDTAEAAGGKWKKDGKKWWYSYSNGTYPKSKWEKIGGKWYHFDKWGYMQTGWQKISGKWYYFGSNGIMRTGWQKISKKWYYFSNGVMKTGWLKSGGKWYYLDGSGAMVTGTKTIGGVKYTFDSDGVMKEESSESSDETESLANAEVGDIITFGQYEQDNNTSNGKEAIEWQVLDKKQDGSLLVLSKYGLDCQKYDSNAGEFDPASWDTCTLRSWLNSTFLNAAFSASEKAKIAATTLVTGAHTEDWEYYEQKTNDKVFLLSEDEVMQYFELEQDGLFGRSDSVLCDPTAYAVAKGVNYRMDYITEEMVQYDGECIWWLRSPSTSTIGIVTVDNAGYVYSLGDSASYGYIAVRPAMWIQP